MSEAELAVRKATADIPVEIAARLESTEKLTDEDRDAILQPVRDALAPFMHSQKLKEIT
jgi:F-type H+-transporting ATPase subunit alpha